MFSEQSLKRRSINPYIIMAIITGSPSDSTGYVQPKAKARKASPPGTPEVEDIGKNSVELEWGKPRNDGGSPVEGENK